MLLQQFKDVIYTCLASSRQVDGMYLYFADTMTTPPTPSYTDTASDVFDDIATYKGILRIPLIKLKYQNNDSNPVFVSSSGDGTAYGLTFDTGVVVYATSMVLLGATKEQDKLVNYSLVTKINDAYPVKAANADLMMTVSFDMQTT